MIWLVILLVLALLYLAVGTAYLIAYYLPWMCEEIETRVDLPPSIYQQLAVETVVKRPKYTKMDFEEYMNGRKK